MDRRVTDAWPRPPDARCHAELSVGDRVPPRFAVNHQFPSKPLGRLQNCKPTLALAGRPFPIPCRPGGSAPGARPRRARPWIGSLRILVAGAAGGGGPANLTPADLEPKRAIAWTAAPVRS